MPLSYRLFVRSLCRATSSSLFSYRPLQLAPVSFACWSPQRACTATARSVSSRVPSAFHSGVPSPSLLDAQPSSVEIHQVIARAVQRGRWEHAIRLLLGALQSHCVPLAETYQLVLLAALRGGGWQSSVELTEQIATSPLSAAALYHTAADLILSQLGQGSHGFSEVLALTVVEQLVPLMLADSTRHVAWKPRHRECVLHVLAETNDPQLVTALFQRWVAPSTAASTASAAGVYKCSEREAALLMTAFAATGDWRSAETLRVRLPTVSDNLLVDYVRAFITALKHSGRAPAPVASVAGFQQTPAASRSQLVPWETAMDVAEQHKGTSALTAAAAQLRQVARQSAAPTDVSRWWWSAETTSHMKLMELRRRALESADEVMQFLAQCHVATAGVAELMRVIESSGVLSISSDLSRYWTQWLNVVLALSRYCPSALVTSNGCADGLARLLPQPHLKVPRLTFAYSSTQVDAGEGTDIPLWQYVATYLLTETAGSDEGSGTTRCVQTFTATLHYLLYAQKRLVSPADLSTPAAQEITDAVEHACEVWSQRLQRLQSCRNNGRPSAIIENKYAIAAHLHTLSAFTQIPTFEQCVNHVMCDAAAMTGVVDTSTLAYMKPLEQLGKATALCEVMCAVLSNAASPSSHAVYLLTLFTCHQLQEGTAVVELWSLLQQVESLRSTVPHADELALLSAQLQWCWGGSFEGLRALAIPMLLRRRRWCVLARLLAHCAPPLSAQEQQAAITCAVGQRLAELQRLVSAGDAASAWDLWSELNSNGAAELPISLPVPLHTALVSLLIANGRTEQACEVLAVAPAKGMVETASHASWPHLGLRVCRHVLHHPESEVTLTQLWEVAKVNKSAVMKRESTMGLAMFAAMALWLVRREAAAFGVLHDAATYVVQYDAKYHKQQHSTPSRDDGLEEESDWRGSSFALHKTDAQLSEGILPYVQCSVPSILLSALLHAATADAKPGSSQAASTVLQLTRHVFLLTSHTKEAIGAWSAVLPQLYTTALQLAENQKGPICDDAAKADPVTLALSIARCLLFRAVEQQMAVSNAVLHLAVTAITTRAFSPNTVAALIGGVRQALCALREGSDARASNSTLTVQTVASQVAQSLAEHGSYTQALEWVNEFNLWTATGDARITAETLWQWIQADFNTAQRQADARASLRHQRRSDATAREAAEGKDIPAEPPSLETLNALIQCDAWQDAFDRYLQVILAPKISRPNNVADLAHFSHTVMEYAELRDTYLTPRVLSRVMQCLARNAPWQTCVQAWMLLCCHLPLFSWSESVSQMAPALQLLLSQMQQQGAQPHDVGTVLVWMAAQLDTPLPVVLPLLQHYAVAIAAAPAWTRAEGELCAERLQQLRCHFGEQRTHEAVQAITEAAAALALAPPSLHTCDDGGVVSSEAWLPLGRPLLSSSEMDALVVLAPLLLLATTPQLEVLAQRHLDGRFQGFELKALLWTYRDELLERVNAAQESERDDALVQFLARNVTLHVCASQAFAQGVSNSETAVVEWLATTVFDNLIPRPLAARLWRACRTPAATLAACRWTELAEAELCEAVLRHHGRPPARLRAAPHLRRQDIAHYWSCFHRLLEPELHFGPLELCCLAAYVPVLTRLRTQHPDPAQHGYKSAMRELAGHVHRAHFSPSRVPAEDTLAYMRRPHSPAAIATVMTLAYKPLNKLHTQVFEGVDAAAKSGVLRMLPLRLRHHFAVCAATVPSLDEIPRHLQQPNLAAAARRLSGLSTDQSAAPRAPVNSTGHSDCSTANAPPSTSELLAAAQGRIFSLFIRSWVSWVMAACVVPRQPIPPAASLLLVEWVKSTVHSPRSGARTDVAVTPADAARLLWHAQAAAGQRELQQRRCRELSCVWRMLTDADAWSLMDVGHRLALEKMVSPSPAQVKALPTKIRGDGSHTKTRIT